MLQNTGQLDISGKIIPFNTGTWSDLSGTTWDNFSSWISEPESPLNWSLLRVDLGRITYFNLQIECQAEGEVSYEVYTSETGAFNGEETTTVISAGDTDIPAFYGRYYVIAVQVERTGKLNTLDNVNVTATTETFLISRSGINSSSFAGTASSRTLPLDRNVSHIWSIDIKATSSTHTLQWYVTDYPTSNTLIPVINSKTRTGPTFKLIGLDNVARDGIIDYEIVAMPEQRRDGNNLILV